MEVQVGDGLLCTLMFADDQVVVTSDSFQLYNEKTHGRVSEMETVVNIRKTECTAVVENCEYVVADSERMKICCHVSISDIIHSYSMISISVVMCTPWSRRFLVTGKS
jgi:hypothetical protein